jgi:DinB superfamily
MSFIENQIEELNKLNEKFSFEFAELSQDKMDWKPGENIWGINECLDHIIQSNRKYYPIFDSMKNGTYKEGKWTRFPLLPRMMGKMVVKAVSPDYKRKSKTFPPFYPLSSHYGKNLTTELIDENKILIEKLRKCKEEDLDKIIITSPINSFITYSLRDCIKILVEHEKRHFNQAMNIKLKEGKETVK